MALIYSPDHETRSCRVSLLIKPLLIKRFGIIKTRSQLPIKRVEIIKTRSSLLIKRFGINKTLVFVERSSTVRLSSMKNFHRKPRETSKEINSPREETIVTTMAANKGPVARTSLVARPSKFHVHAGRL